jgi:hypothetical protein
MHQHLRIVTLHNLCNCERKRVGTRVGTGDLTRLSNQNAVTPLPEFPSSDAGAGNRRQMLGIERRGSKVGKLARRVVVLVV